MADSPSPASRRVLCRPIMAGIGVLVDSPPGAEQHLVINPVDEGPVSGREI